MWTGTGAQNLGQVLSDLLYGLHGKRTRCALSTRTVSLKCSSSCMRVYQQVVFSIIMANELFHFITPTLKIKMNRLL